MKITFSLFPNFYKHLDVKGLAARVHTIVGVEANSRQFFPAANDLVAKVHPGIATVRDGYARTSSLRGTGLGTDVEEIPGFAEAVEKADADFRRAAP